MRGVNMKKWRDMSRMKWFDLVAMYFVGMSYIFHSATDAAGMAIFFGFLRLLIWGAKRIANIQRAKEADRKLKGER